MKKKIKVELKISCKDEVCDDCAFLYHGETWMQSKRGKRWLMDYI